MSHPAKIVLGIAGPELPIINRDFAVSLDDDSRFHYAIQANTLQLLTMQLAQGEPDLLIVYGDLGPSPDELVSVLGNIKNAIVIVLLPVALATLKGVFERIGTVKRVIVLPTPANEILNAGESLVNTARVINSTVIPSVPVDRSGGHHTGGTRFIGVVSVQGGTGRTTIAEAMAYELGVRRNLNTLLCAFDCPSPTPLHLKVSYTVSAEEYFSRPGAAGFADSLQHYASSENLNILLAPQNTVAYEQAAERSLRAMRADAQPQDQPSSIRQLLFSAYSRMYAGVILDLPATLSPWTWHSMTVPNTVLIVARPTTDSLKAVGTITQILTNMLASEHQFQKTSIFLVLNMRTSESTYTPISFNKEVSEHYGWCPPVIACLDYDPRIPAAQDERRPVAELSDSFQKGIISLVDSFWPGMNSSQSSKPKKGTKIGPFNFVKV